MKVSYRTKEQSNEKQEEDFQKLSPIERISAFLDLMYYTKDLPKRHSEEEKDNFVVEIRPSKQ